MPILESAIATPLFFVLGLVMGSFGNVVISRIPQEESITGRSHCPKCGRTLSAWELIPVFSWVLLRGKCRGCGKSISFQYPAVELISAVLFVVAAQMTGGVLLAGISLSMALWVMLMIAVIDMRMSVIPDALTLVLAVSAVAYHFTIGSQIVLIPALIGIGFFGAQWILSKGRWVGSGDIFLSGALGLLIGSWQLMILALMVSYIIGAAIASILLASGRTKKSANIAFGPFLILGAVITMLWGQKILEMLLPA